MSTTGQESRERLTRNLRGKQATSGDSRAATGRGSKPVPTEAVKKEPVLPSGTAWPLGAQWIEAEQAFNFALYSRHATGVTLLCYHESDPAVPVFEFRLQYPAHKTGSVWHC